MFNFPLTVVSTWFKDIKILGYIISSLNWLSITIYCDIYFDICWLRLSLTKSLTHILSYTCLPQSCTTDWFSIYSCSIDWFSDLPILLTGSLPLTVGWWQPCLWHCFLIYSETCSGIPCSSPAHELFSLHFCKTVYTLNRTY